MQDTCAHLRAAAITQVKKELLDEFRVKVDKTKAELYKDLEFIYDAVFSERQGTQHILLNLQQTAQAHRTVDEDYKDQQALLKRDLEDMDTTLQERKDKILLLEENITALEVVKDAETVKTVISQRDITTLRQRIVCLEEDLEAGRKDQ